MQKWIKNEKGVTLLEVVLLIVVISFAMLPISRLVNMNVKFTADMTKITEATFVAQDKMEQLISDYAKPNGFDLLKAEGYDGGAGSRYPSSLYYEADDGYTVEVYIDSATTNIHNGIRYVDVVVSVGGEGLSNNLELSVWLFK